MEGSILWTRPQQATGRLWAIQSCGPGHWAHQQAKEATDLFTWLVGLLAQSSPRSPGASPMPSMKAG